MNVVVANVTGGGFSGGYRKYLARLMPLLSADRRVNRLTVFAPPGTVDLAGLDVRAWHADDARRGYASLTREVAALAPDVVFVPTARHVAFGRTPVVTMLRNMEPLERPFEGHTPTEALRNAARAWQARRACRRAARVIAVSEHVRAFLVSKWRLDDRKVGLAYHGVDPSGLPDARPNGATLFTAGSIRPARGLEDLIGAMSRLDTSVTLDIAGAVDRGCEKYAARLRRLADETGVAGRIRWRGQLDEHGVAAALGSVRLFVMTSRAEACPNIVLEAIAHGVPSVSTDRQPMPEFFGGAARYYAEGDANALAHRVTELLRDDRARSDLSCAAMKRACLFTWERTKDATISELEAVL